jgi:hypothetical protein
MTGKKTCGEYKRLKGWPDPHRVCGKPAKFVCDVPPRIFGCLVNTPYRCGIHAKRYEKIERIDK